MADDPKTPEPIVVEGAQPQVYSPSPTPGEPPPKRRAEDSKTYTGEWVVLLIAVLTWASTFLADIALLDSWSELGQPKILALQLSKLTAAILSVLAAKRIK